MQHAWERSKMHTIFWFENLTGRDHSEDLGVDGRMYWNGSQGNGGEVVDWTHLAQDWDQGRVL